MGRAGADRRRFVLGPDGRRPSDVHLRGFRQAGAGLQAHPRRPAPDRTADRPGDAEPRASPETPDGPEPLTIRKPMVAPRPTYRQDWPSYNRAQIHEKAQFLTLLTELCRGIPEPSKDPEGVKRG